MSYAVKVGSTGGEMTVNVNYGLTSAGTPGLYLRSSIIAAPVLPAAAWPAGVAAIIAYRLRNKGQQKGRVLSIWQDTGAGAPVPLAVLAWHAHSTGPLTVFELASALAIEPPTGNQLCNILLDSLLEAACHSSSPVHSDWHRVLWWSGLLAKNACPPAATGLAWRQGNLRRAYAAGFVKQMPPPIPGAWTSGAWLGQRS